MDFLISILRISLMSAIVSERIPDLISLKMFSRVLERLRQSLFDCEGIPDCREILSQAIWYLLRYLAKSSVLKTLPSNTPKSLSTSAIRSAWMNSQSARSLSSNVRSTDDLESKMDLLS